MKKSVSGLEGEERKREVEGRKGGTGEFLNCVDRRSYKAWEAVELNEFLRVKP